MVPAQLVSPVDAAQLMPGMIREQQSLKPEGRAGAGRPAHQHVDRALYCTKLKFHRQLIRLDTGHIARLGMQICQVWIAP